MKGPWENPSSWSKTNKKQYVIKACIPPLGTQVYNRLEDCAYVTNPQKMVVLTGTVGEQWTIDMGKLCKTYTLPDGSPITEATLRAKQTMTPQGPVVKPFNIRSKTGVQNWCYHLPAGLQLPVQTSWGETLMANRPGIPHGDGDWLVCADKGGRPDLADVWVVNGEVFPSTYNMKSAQQSRDGADSRPASAKLVGRTQFAQVANRLGRGDVAPQNVQLLIRYRDRGGAVKTSNINLMRCVLDINGDNYLLDGDEQLGGLAISVNRQGFFDVMDIRNMAGNVGYAVNMVWAAIPNANEKAASGPSVKYVEQLNPARFR